MFQLHIFKDEWYSNQNKQLKSRTKNTWIAGIIILICLTTIIEHVLNPILPGSSPVRFLSFIVALILITFSAIYLFISLITISTIKSLLKYGPYVEHLTILKESEIAAFVGPETKTTIRHKRYIKICISNGPHYAPLRFYFKNKDPNGKPTDEEIKFFVTQQLSDADGKIDQIKQPEDNETDS